MQPLWVIKGPEQIRVGGFQTLDGESLKSLLPLEYPQSLLNVEPTELEAALLENAPLRSATVSRQLLPPGLRIQIQERQPVAVAELAVKKGKDSPASDASDSSTASAAEGAVDDPARSSTKKAKRGVRVLLDEAGDWVPLDQYAGEGQNFELPRLTVIGMREEYREPWSNLYRALSQSPMEVSEIDWRDPSNLKLMTELGRVHLGPYGNQFSQQLQVLDRMRDLPAHQQANQVDYIDLRSPLLPRLRMKLQASTSD